MDISPTLVSQMQHKYETYTGVEFLVMDVREMSGLAASTYTLVIDKGCVDALFCRTDYKDSVEQALNEIVRVMTMEGIFVYFSHAPKLARVPYLRLVRWAVEAIPCLYGGGEAITMFTMTKTDDEELLSRKIAGAEAALRPKLVNTVSQLDQKMNKSSMTKASGNTGSVTVTVSRSSNARHSNSYVTLFWNSIF